jgi:hypothetical protein
MQAAKLALACGLLLGSSTAALAADMTPQEIVQGMCNKFSSA